MKLRKKVKNALLKPAMIEYYETAESGQPPPQIEDIVATIFKSLDDDGDGTLDYEELEAGLEEHDVCISIDEFKKMVEIVDQVYHLANSADQKLAFQTILKFRCLQFEVYIVRADPVQHAFPQKYAGALG
eukprot:SAG11_NODE_3088_length_2703_cov_1.540707_1_plen_129_part_10